MSGDPQNQPSEATGPSETPDPKPPPTAEERAARRTEALKTVHMPHPHGKGPLAKARQASAAVKPRRRTLRGR